MKANYKDKIPQNTSTVSLGNLYDMNKQLMEHEAAINPEVLDQEEMRLENWLEANFNQKYFMLLCHERRDYTVFNLDKTDTWATPNQNILRTAREDVIECLTNRGTLLAAQLQEDGVWEFWIRDTEQQCAAYYFFPYGAAVLEY